MAIFGSLSVVRAQTEGRANFAPAFTYLEEVLREGSEARQRILALTAGQGEKVELSAGVFAMEQSYESKERYDAFESHRSYIDIQVIVAGEELMEVADISKLPVSHPYDADRDVIIYGDFKLTSVLRVVAGEAAVYFPEDGHMPNLRVGADPVLIKKTVVKVPV
ncbi:MAG: YhcH/YjgK/YiaL family protein [Opitutaceae bacterium]|jgi:biofilm protein TabA|nr:YhcH/YjgK/YiaL family protein [Opitutaceae bacterium]|tara:strand:- start:821 stop:1312 length:492 start_codon:yes stop_codon:yes gene_type:complete